MKIISLLGQSGCGKNSQSNLILEKYGKEDLFYIESGACIGSFFASNGYLADSVRENNNKGKLAPISVLMHTLMDHFNQNYKGEHIVLWNGSPRSLLELEVLSGFYSFIGVTDNIVIHINLDDEECTRRILARNAAGSKRQDTSTKEALQNKLAFYNVETSKVLSVLRGKSSLVYGNDIPKIVEIDGYGTEQEVHNRIMSHI